MSRGRPWYKRNGAEFVMATLGMPDSDHKWAYSAILDMLNERDRPLPDDPGFICGFTGLSKRRWAPVRAYLLDHGYLMLDHEGNLTNARFERERAERLESRDAAVEHGRQGGLASAAKRAQPQPELDLEPQIISGKTGDKREIKSPKTENNIDETNHTANELNDLAQAPPQASRGRESASESRREKNQTNDHTDSELSARDRSIDDSTDLMQLLDAVSEASGYRPTEPGQIARALDLIKQWRDEPISFEHVVLPTIRTIVADTPDPTSSLKRFDKRIRHEAARLKANGSKAPPRPPPDPVLEPSGEDPMFRPVRQSLLAKLTPRSYALVFNDVRFEDLGQCHGDKHPLKVSGPDYLAQNVRHGPYAKALLAAARPLGFTEVW